jgi:hypothetical protein
MGPRTRGLSFASCGRVKHVRPRFLLLLMMAALAGLQPSAAFAYEFGPLVKQIGSEQTVFDWSTDRCEDLDIPDIPARAFRDSAGQVHLFASHFVTRAEVGSSLDTVRHSCAVAMGSDYYANPSYFDDRRWIGATYTPDGKTVAALLHEEYQGNTHAGQCPSKVYTKCWYNAITFALSTDGGKSFSQTWPVPLVAASPYKYVPDAGPYGLFMPSNIVYKDGYYYSIVRAEPYQAQRYGACLMRTSKPTYPASWRGWNGTNFWVRFVNPYTDSSNPAAHVCEPLDFQGLGPMTESLTYNSYFGKFMLAGAGSRPDPVTGQIVDGVYFALSSDLIHWSTRRLIMKAEFPWTVTQCEDLNPINYPSILGLSSGSRNFDVVGRRAYLYFTRGHWSSWHSTCSETLDRDLVRIPIEFGATSP